MQARCLNATIDLVSALQVRAFAKEGAACGKYEDAVQCVLQWGLASAFASGLFFAGNFILSTGMDIPACCQQAIMRLPYGLIQGRRITACCPCDLIQVAAVPNSAASLPQLACTHAFYLSLWVCLHA